ncbi:hypothetical protein D3C84_526550 [compost metagenome]
MASVDKAETSTMVNISARSFCGCDGNAIASANAADPPQIAVAPPLNSPNRCVKPIARAARIDTVIVATTAISASTTGGQPSPKICSKVIRVPSSAIPTCDSLRAVNSMPGAHGPSLARKFIAIPSSSANSISGAP